LHDATRKKAGSLARLLRLLFASSRRGDVEERAGR